MSIFIFGKLLEEGKLDIKNKTTIKLGAGLSWGIFLFFGLELFTIASTFLNVVGVLCIVLCIFFSYKYLKLN